MNEVMVWSDQGVMCSKYSYETIQENGINHKVGVRLSRGRY